MHTSSSVWILAVAITPLMMPPPLAAQSCPLVQVEVRLNSISLAWKECVGVEFSRLRMQGPSGTFRVVYDGPGQEYTASGLAPNTDYRFRLQVRNAGGWGRVGEIVTFHTTGTPPCPAMPAQCPVAACAFAPIELKPGSAPDCAARQQLVSAASTGLARIEASIKAAYAEFRRRRGAGASPAELQADVDTARARLVPATAPSGGVTGDSVAAFYLDAFGFESMDAYFAKTTTTDFATQAGQGRLRDMTEDQIYDALDDQWTALVAQSVLHQARQGDSARCPAEVSAAQADASREQAEESAQVPGYTSCAQSWNAKWQVCADFARAAWEHVLEYKLDPVADCGYPADGGAGWR
ncbi:MAG: fibronectin type III domain-containing protein [Bryobacteraceae bacterium]